MRKFFGLFALVAMIGFMSCGDDEKTNTELLTQHNSWQAKKITYPDGNVDEDDVDAIRYSFGSTGSYSFTPLTGDVVVGTWEFQSAESEIHVDTSDGDQFHFTISELTDDVLTIEHAGTSISYQLEPAN